MDAAKGEVAPHFLKQRPPKGKSIMKLVKFSLAGIYTDPPEELVAKIRAICPDAPSAIKYYTELEADIEDISSLGVEVTLKPVEVPVTAIWAMTERLKQIEQRFASDYSRETSYNSKCEVHVPGLGLLLIDEVQCIEDACTDALQSHLDEGWRIVACCPQPDSRRPDYIIGRKKA
jgi:hypothetical protein